MVQIVFKFQNGRKKSGVYDVNTVINPSLDILTKVDSKKTPIKKHLPAKKSDTDKTGRVS